MITHDGKLDWFVKATHPASGPFQSDQFLAVTWKNTIPAFALKFAKTASIPPLDGVEMVTSSAAEI